MTEQENSHPTPVRKSRRHAAGSTEAVRRVFGDIAPAWGRMMAAARERVLVFTPYLTSVEQLRRRDAEVPLRLYTEFSVELFASGASSFRAVKTVAGWGGTEVFWLPDLHAKVVVVDGAVLTIGSQNVTARGRKNLEATVSIADGPVAAEAEARLAAWQARAIPITKEMLAEMEAMLPPLAKMHRAYKKACAPGEDRFKALYDAEILRRQEEEEARKAAEKKRQDEIALLKAAVEKDLYIALSQMQDAMTSPLTVEEARRLIAHSNVWFCGEETKDSPGDAKYVYRSQKYGLYWAKSRTATGNKFLIEIAVTKFRLALKGILEDMRAGTYRRDYDGVLREFKTLFFECVASHQSVPFRKTYPESFRYLRIGSHAVDFFSFYNEFMNSHWAAARLIANMDKLHRLEAELSAHTTS